MTLGNIKATSIENKEKPRIKKMISRTTFEAMNIYLAKGLKKKRKKKKKHKQVHL